MSAATSIRSSARLGRQVAVEPQHVASAIDGPGDEAAGHDGTHRMQPELERRRDAEVSAAAANRPEQVGVLVRRGADDAAVGQHQLDTEQVVQRHSMLRHEPAEPAAEREAGHTGGRHDAAGRGEPVHLRFPVELCPERAARSARRACGGVDVHVLHERQVDHQALVDGRPPADVVPAAAYRDLETAVARETHGKRDVGAAAALGDQRGPLVHQAVVNVAARRPTRRRRA